MEIKCKSFDLLGLTEGELSFIAEAYYNEASKDFDEGYMALARTGFDKAQQFFRVIAHESDWYELRLRYCKEKLAEIAEQEN